MTIYRDIIWINPNLVIGNQSNGANADVVFFRKVKMLVNMANASNFFNFFPIQSVGAVSGLIRFGNPSTVVGNVISHCINSIKGQILLITGRHRPLIKWGKVFPFIKIRNAVFCVAFLFMMTPVFHSLPALVKSSSRLPVSNWHEIISTLCWTQFTDDNSNSQLHGSGFLTEDDV